MEKRLILFLAILLVIVVVRVSLYFVLKPEVSLGQVNFVTHLSTQPKVYNSYQSFSVNLPTGEFVFVKASPDLALNYGDRVIISGNLNTRVLNKSELLVIENAKTSLDNRSENQFLAVVNRIRQQISHTFYEYLPNDLAGLLLGIVIGVKVNFSPQFLNSLKLSGVMHVIAASGMNVAMVGGFFFYAFSVILKRQRAIIMSVLIIIFYAFLAGLQPSIIRASIMASILFASQIWGRQNYSFYSLVLTFLIMLFMSPQFLVDVGFQLSFVSTLGLLFLPPIFGGLRNIISDDLTTTLSAQIASLPILLTYFGTYSVWSVVVNFLVLWTIPPLMILGGLAALISLVFSPLAKPILILSLPLLTYFKAVTSYFSELPGVISLDGFPVVITLGYYLILLSLITFKFKKKVS